MTAPTKRTPNPTTATPSPPQEEKGDLLFPGAVAEMIGFYKDSIQRWIDEGLLTPDNWVNNTYAVFTRRRIEQLQPILAGGKRALVAAKAKGDERLTRYVPTP